MVQLDEGLAALGPHRLTIAARAAAAAAGGGAGVGTKQEHQIARLARVALRSEGKCRVNRDRMTDAPDARVFVRHILALEAIGWRVVGFQPSIDGDEPALWHVTIERADENASMTAIQVDLEVALEELVRYTRVDAR